jgi:hypothetical protein
MHVWARRVFLKSVEGIVAIPEGEARLVSLHFETPVRGSKFGRTHAFLGAPSRVQIAPFNKPLDSCAAALTPA